MHSDLVRVSGPCVPCADWVKLTIVENHTGFYLRVLEPGTVQPRAAWSLQERLNPEGSILAINRCMYLDFDTSYAQRIAQMQGLGEWWQEQARERQAKRREHWTATMTG